MSGSFIQPNNFYRAFGKEEVEQSIPDRFESMVRLFPNNLAVKSQQDQYGYDALNREDNRVAWAILPYGHDNDLPIAIFLSQGPPQIMVTRGGNGR